MENWKSVTIGEIAKLNTTSYSEKEKWEYVNYLDTGSIVENKIYSIQYFDTQKDSVPSRAKRKVRKNSIIYSTVRPNQRHYGIIKTIPENFLVSTGFTVIDVDETVADADFVYYSLACDNVTDRLMTIANNSTSSYPSITPDDIAKTEIKLPNIATQKKIAGLLGLLDRKIAENDKINDNLEQQIRLLYEYWFVQFNFPDSKGNPYRLSNGKMQWNDDLKTLIPEEWHCKQIIEVASIDNESLNPSNFGTQLMEHYSIPAFDETHCPRFERANTIESNKYVVNNKAILVSKLNPQFKRIWDPFCETQNAICSTEFISYVPHKEEERSFLYAVLDSDAFYIHSVQRATSSTGSRKRIQPEVSASFKFAYPNDECIIDAFCDLCTPILKKKKDLLKESQDLRALKDWLLPFIMKGQFSISD